MANKGWFSKSLKQRQYLEAQARINEHMKDLFAYNNDLKEEPGIYIITRSNKPRMDGTIQKYAYVGQAKNVLKRLAQHFVSYEQEIDVSLKNRALKYPSNPYGWHIEVEYCPIEQLNERERYWIKQYQDDPSYKILNITSGGQDEGKEDINERKATKKYSEGLKVGYQNCLKDIKEFFEKYLDFDIKPTLVKKDGTRTAISLKKYDEFNELMKGGKNNG